ncbi:MAG: fused response regulator/phosphatase [Magnetococcales bacterium]|nr:fused response regulator/phosphatase [Magnetococcales bacterium]
MLTKTTMATILIVDDDLVIRYFLETLLRKEGYTVVSAANGREALACMEHQWCDLVLMDILMPVLDGYQTTRQIKIKEPQERFIPVIFLTSAQSDDELARCLECGGDDFLTKPPNSTILKARIRSWLQRAELTNKLVQDREDVENVILKLRHDDQFDHRGLRVLVTPLESTNGDLVLSARRDDGIHHVLVGDFTGHGLAAAICGPLVADIFYRLTRQGVSLDTILSQINETIFRRLPTHMFLAAAFLELDRRNNKMRLWNASLPVGTLFRSGRSIDQFPSCFPPLGIGRRLTGLDACTHHHLEEEDRIYLFSDGIVETRSPTHEFFGEERLISFLERLTTPDMPLTALLPILEEFRAGKQPTDDVTLVEVNVSPRRPAD